MVLLDIEIPDMNGHFGKPLNMDEVLEILRTY